MKDNVRRRGTWCAWVLMLFLLPGRGPAQQPAPVKLFVLAGQSNMQGQGAVSTLDWLGHDAAGKKLLEKLKAPDGSWVVRDDVWVYYPRARGGLKKGKLTVGFGARDDKIGPELTFGHVMGDYFDEPVLLVKAAWGGKSLATDFRPPSAGGQTGLFYTDMLKIVRDATENLDAHFPELAGRRCEITGLVWFQGWNDMIRAERVAEYESNLVHLIQDVRRDLGVPRLPVVIGELGVGGPESAADNPRMAGIRRAQAAVAEHPELKGTVACVATSKYWDHEAHQLLRQYWIKHKWTDKQAHQRFQKMGSQPPYHYLGSGRIFALIGYGFGQAMKELLEKNEPARPGRRGTPGGPADHGG